MIQKTAKKRAALIVCLCAAAAVIVIPLLYLSIQYQKGITLLEQQHFSQAYEILAKIPPINDEAAKNQDFAFAGKLTEEENFEQAAYVLSTMPEESRAQALAEQCADALFAAGQYDEVRSVLQYSTGNYADYLRTLAAVNEAYDAQNYEKVLETAQTCAQLRQNTELQSVLDDRLDQTEERSAADLLALTEQRFEDAQYDEVYPALCVLTQSGCVTGETKEQLNQQYSIVKVCTGRSCTQEDITTALDVWADNEWMRKACEQNDELLAQYLQGVWKSRQGNVISCDQGSLATDLPVLQQYADIYLADGYLMGYRQDTGQNETLYTLCAAEKNAMYVFDGRTRSIYRFERQHA